MNEHELVDRLCAQDADAYEELVRTHTGRLLAVARRFLDSEEDARDAVQEGFLAVFRSIDRFERGSRLSTWLHQIVVNASLMRLRTRRRKAEQPIEELLPRFAEDGHFLEPVAPWAPSAADAAAESREVREIVRDAIDRLPASHRTVLLLRDIEQLDTAEAAERLNLTANAVKVRLHRARLALRAAIEPVLRGAASPAGSRHRTGTLDDSGARAAGGLPSRAA